MIQFIRDLLGTYAPVTYQVWDSVKEEFLEVIPAGLAGVDFGYVFAAMAFLIVLYCTLKCLGALICKIF